MGILLAALAGPGTDAAPGGQMTIAMWAMEASKEGNVPKQFDSQLMAIRKVVNDLPFDTYKTIRVSRTKVGYGGETRITVDARYTLIVKPLEKLEDDRIRLSIRIEMKPERARSRDAKPVNVVSTRVEVSPRKKIKLRGLKSGEKEMVIVLEAS